MIVESVTESAGMFTSPVSTSISLISSQTSRTSMSATNNTCMPEKNASPPVTQTSKDTNTLVMSSASATSPFPCQQSTSSAVLATKQLSFNSSGPCTANHTPVSKNSTLIQGKSSRWNAYHDRRLSIALYNFRASNKSPQCLDLLVGDVVIVLEHFNNHQWLRGYLEHDPKRRLGIFPANLVKCFPNSNRHNCDENEVYFKVLMDPLFFQVIRTVREWHQQLLNFYRHNSNLEKTKQLQKVILELVELCQRTLAIQLAPQLWCKRNYEIFKASKNDPSNLYLDQDIYGTLPGTSPAAIQNNNDVGSKSLEELYGQVVSRLNFGNQLLNNDIMPSFTSGTFSSNHSEMMRKNSNLAHQFWFQQSWQQSSSKFVPFSVRPNSKHLLTIFNYYQRFQSQYLQRSKMLNSRPGSRGVMSPVSPLYSPLHRSHQSSDPSTSCSGPSRRKLRRHLLLSIREANFTSLTYESEQMSPIVQVDAYIIRYNSAANSQNSVSVDNSAFIQLQGGDQPFQILTEKYCYRFRANGSSTISGSATGISKALFLDILSHKNKAFKATSQQSEASNLFLVLQVWRYGKMMNSGSIVKSNSTASSVFHTISSSSISSAATNNSLSSLTSTLFSTSDRNTSSNSSSTPDSSSIDSSELGSSGVFKRSVGFSVVPLLELVSRDQEIKTPNSMELFKDESVFSHILLTDEPMLLSVPIKLHEGDMTSTLLETALKNRSQNSGIASTGSSSSNLNPGTSSSSKLNATQNSANNHQLVLCAKFVSEFCDDKHKEELKSKGQKHSSSASSVMVNSMADWLLLSKSAMSSFVIVQKALFGDLITPGHFRNDFYLTLESAEFEKGGKAIPKNIELSICLVTENGIQERALSAGSNDEPVTFYRSHIQYHQNSPKWFEHLKVKVPLELFESAYLRFTFCHCSSKDRDRKLVGFSFLPLANKNGACLSNGEHELFVYKCDHEKKLDDANFYVNVPWGPSSGAGSGTLSSQNSTSSSSLSSTSSLISSRSSKEIFIVRTNLVSSKLTQNCDILSLLKYSCTPLEQVYDALQRIGRVPGEEMVKFLEDILDALFALFTQTSGNLETTTSNQNSLIFRVLVDFFKTLNDPKFASYQLVLETYIENQFSAPLVHFGLIACVKKYIELVIISFQGETATSLSGVTKRELEFILRCLSVFDWILKIIVQSRILYSKASESCSMSDDFRLEIFSLFSSIQRLLSVDCKSSDDYLIIAIQDSVLKTLPNAFSYLSKILTPLELSKLVQSIVISGNRPSSCSPISSSNSTTPTNQNQAGSSKKTILSGKLILLQETIRCQYVWNEREARLELMDTFIRMLNLSIGESRNCLQILHDIIFYLLENVATNCLVKPRLPHEVKLRAICDREVEMLSYGAIEVIVEHITELISCNNGLSITSPGNTSQLSMTNEMMNAKKRSTSISESNGDANPDENQTYLGQYFVCLIVLLEFMSPRNYEKLFETRSSRQCKEMIMQIFMVFINVLYYFPDNWLEIKMAVNRVILKSMVAIRTTVMVQEFLGGDKFNQPIWNTYFKLAIAFTTQQRLQLEGLPLWKQKLILDIYGGDMRIFMGQELVECWNLIGQSKSAFIPGLVSSFVDVTLVPEPNLRRATIPIIYDMLAVDYEKNGDLKSVEASLIDKLDSIAHKQEFDAEYGKLFTSIFVEKIEKLEPVWQKNGLKLVQSISKLLTLLISYRNELKTKNSLKSAGDSNVSLLVSTFTLLRFYRDEIDCSNSKTIMLRYVDKLASLQVALGNFNEAAFTLMLHAEQLSWSNGNDAHRKELINETVVNYFDKGQCWEEGVKVCAQLQSVYQQNFKYSKLSAILKRNAELLDKIIAQHRPENEYFRVSFYGQRFPLFLRNSTFIFRGYEFEKISSFTHRIQQEFPNAQLLTKPIPTDENQIAESDGQYIQIFVVKPVAEPPVSEDQTLVFGPPDSVLGYYNTNYVRQFNQDRPIQRAPIDPNNEFKSLWIERTTYTTESQLPGVLRMFRVVTSRKAFLAPIENACETIENMNAELSKLVSSYQNDNRPEQLSPLTMRLQGILDAAVNGGIAKYIEAFLCSEYLSSYPDQIQTVSSLKARIGQQIRILEAGLTIHGKLAPTAVRPLHTRFLERFSTMRSSVQKANIETSQALQWQQSSSSQSSLNTSIGGRPSILNQPLPPIPRQESISSACSSSPGIAFIGGPETDILTGVIPGHFHQAIPVTVQHHNQHQQSYNHQRSHSLHSPLKSLVKCKPLPPLPTESSVDDQVELRNNQSNLSNHRHSFSLENSRSMNGSSSVKQLLFHTAMDESIYAVPQLPDLYSSDKGSCVDDDEDDNEVQETVQNGSFFSDLSTIASNGSSSSRPLSGIFRSKSIPRSAMSPYNIGQIGERLNDSAEFVPILHRGKSNQNLAELLDDNGDTVDSGTTILQPPPLPPRTATFLDRSTSLKQMRIPPALPERRERRLSTNGMPMPNTPAPTTPNRHSSVDIGDVGDMLEFENLVISSPTPRSERPAPIIGIEMADEKLFQMVTEGPNSTQTTPSKFLNSVHEHRIKASSLPRMQQFPVENNTRN